MNQVLFCRVIPGKNKPETAYCSGASCFAQTGAGNVSDW